MASFNKTILMGNLTRDPETKYLPAGTAVGSISLAVNRTWFDKTTNQRKEEVTFVDVTLWGKDAEIAGEYLAKGRSVLIEGRLTMETWDDKATGQKRSKLKVTCERLVLCGDRGERPGSQAESEIASAASAFGGTPVASAADGSDPEVPF